jgi:hydroxymethylglutaryl-CoA lyase
MGADEYGHWLRHERRSNMSTSYPKVVITDETLRDGLQIEREGVTLDEKLKLIDMLIAAGIKRLVVGAFVNPKWSPQMADTEQLVRLLKPREGVEYLALALNDRGREIRRQFSPPLSIDPLPTTHLHLCEVFLLRNTNRRMEDQERTWRGPIENARAASAREAAMGLSSAWGSNWRGEFTHERRIAELDRQWDAWTAAGLKVVRVDLADPMAWNTPSRVAEDLCAIKTRYPSVREFHLHLHNARGMAMLSAYEALKILEPHDTLMLDTALGGIGGCPYCGNGQATGMIPTEDLVQLLQVEGVATGIDLVKLIEAAKTLEEILQRPLDGRVAKNGPLPSPDGLYDEDMPVVYTLEQAQHFRKGPGVYEGNLRPWVRTTK